MRWIFIVTVILVAASCAPRTSTSSTTVNLPTCAPPTSLQSSANLGQTLAFLDVKANEKLRELQSLLYVFDPSYSCGLLVNSDTKEAVIAYSVITGLPSGPTTLDDKLSALNENSVTVAVLLHPNYGTRPDINYIKQGSAPTVILAPLSDQAQYFSALSKSKKAVVLSSQVGSSTRPGRSDIYNCSSFTSQAAAQAFFQSTPGDPNRLDADSDGRACEVFDSFTYVTTTIAAPKMFTRRSSTGNYTSPSSSGRCYVSGYTRKNGTRVKGYYRRC